MFIKLLFLCIDLPSFLLISDFSGTIQNHHDLCHDLYETILHDSSVLVNEIPTDFKARIGSPFISFQLFIRIANTSVATAALRSLLFPKKS